jgi:hypothetical protein
MKIDYTIVAKFLFILFILKAVSSFTLFIQGLVYGVRNETKE